jgi:hypothetical protein
MKAPKPESVGFKPFDLNIGTPQQANELIAHLEVMKATAGWHILREIIQGNLAVLERAIVTKTDPETKTAIDDKACDVLRIKHGYLEELMEKPDRLIAQFKKQTGMEVPTYDPYATESKQLRGDGGSQVGAPMARVLADE